MPFFRRANRVGASEDFFARRAHQHSASGGAGMAVVIVDYSMFPMGGGRFEIERVVPADTFRARALVLPCIDGVTRPWLFDGRDCGGP